MRKKSTPTSVFFTVFSLTLVPLFLAQFKQHFEKNKSPKPNIILIVADDLAFGDLACYGGDIETPNINALAKAGVRFGNFHTAPMCAPTRAMLLSGNDNHIAGMGAQARVTEEFGYEGRLTDRIITIPALLQKAGYHTYMAGKWHLGNKPEANPHQKGFEHSFVMLPGAGNHYSSQSALHKGKSKYTEDGEEANWEEGNYSTDFYTDKLIEYIGQNKEDGQPFFAFGAYTSPHWPLQVDKKYWEKYKGRYDEGYEALREKRLNSLKKEGLIPQNTTLPPLHESVKPWDSLSDDEKKREARKMELYAGMVNNLDYNVGRLVKYLKDNGMYENTLIVFMSDNGAAYEDFYNLEEYKVLRTYYNEEYENMGNENSYISYGSQWAEAGNAPFRYFKGYATEGGTHTPMIISGKNVKRVGETFDGFTTVQDLAPTFYALAGIKYPKTFNGKDVYPLRGKSILPFMSGKKNQVHKDNYVYAVEHYGNAMLRKGNWKITNSIRPFKKDNFALYNITLDKGELNDLKTEEPEKYAELLAEWEKFANETKLQIPTPKRKK